MQKLCADIASADETECNRKNAVIAENDFLSDILEPFQNKIKNRIEEIWSAEDGQIFDNILINTDISNTQAISDSIAYIEESGRTEHKNRYIEALKNFTPQNIALTKKYIAWRVHRYIQSLLFKVRKSKETQNVPIKVSGFKVIRINDLSHSQVFLMINIVYSAVAIENYLSVHAPVSNKQCADYG